MALAPIVQEYYLDIERRATGADLEPELKKKGQELEDKTLGPKPIEDGELLAAFVEQLKAGTKQEKTDAYRFIVFNTVPGTTEAATEKANFLKEVILGETKIGKIAEIEKAAELSGVDTSAAKQLDPDFAFELLESMRGGQAITVLIDLLSSDKKGVAEKAADRLSNMVFLYEKEYTKLAILVDEGNEHAIKLLDSYRNAEWFKNKDEVAEEIEVVVYVAKEGDISTDDYSPGKNADSRADREKHGKFNLTEKARNEIIALQEANPNARIMISSKEGTNGVGSSRMSGINNVALLTGKQVSPYTPHVNNFPIVAGGDGVAPIFGVTVDVTGGIALTLPPESLETGAKITINTKDKVAYNEAGEEIADISANLGPQTMDNIRAGGSYDVAFGRIAQDESSRILSKAAGQKLEAPEVFSKLETVTYNRGQTAIEKLLSSKSLDHKNGKFHAGSVVRAMVDVWGSQDTTGPLTQQELQAMSATELSSTITAAFQSFCHTAAVRDPDTIAKNEKLAEFMHKLGVITGRSPDESYTAMTDVIHKVLNDMVVDDWALILGGDSHTRMSKGAAFGVDSGTLALAGATGQTTMAIPETIKVTFNGEVPDGMDFRDVVAAVQKQMLEANDGKNIYAGKVIELHMGSMSADLAFAMTDWTAEMKAKGAINIMDDPTLIKSLETSIERLQGMKDAGMDNNKLLTGLIRKANARIKQIEKGAGKEVLRPDADAKYAGEISIDLGRIEEPYITDPEINAEDESTRYTHDSINGISDYDDKQVDVGFIGSCMISGEDIKTVANMLRQMEKRGEISPEKNPFRIPLVIAAPTAEIYESAKQDFELIAKYAVRDYRTAPPRDEKRTAFQEGAGIYLEPPGCNLCMGNQDKAPKGSTILATSTRLFEGRVVEGEDTKIVVVKGEEVDLSSKSAGGKTEVAIEVSGNTEVEIKDVVKGESLLGSTPLVVSASLLGRVPSLSEYRGMVKDVPLAQFTPPEQALTSQNRGSVKSVEIDPVQAIQANQAVA